MELKFGICIFAILATLYGAQGSPFLLMEKFVEDFEKGLNELHESSHFSSRKQEDYIPEHYNETAAIIDAEQFDFVIIGGGTSGSVLANRLSEVPEWKVLLLEAGAPELESTKVPKMRTLVQTTPFSWGYKTIPQKSTCLGMIDNRCTLESGRALGGSSAINDMIYTRGNPKDYDLWADVDNLGWCWNDVFEHYKKIEDSYIKHFDRKYHHLGGEMHLENPQYYDSKLREHIFEAGHELGIKTVDYNGKEQLGLGVPQVTTKGGKRFSTTEAYLEETVGRPNLVIRPLSHVIKIIIGTHTKEATGVQYIHDEKLLIAKAKKEVILAAGAVNSPQLLMLSGVGVKEDLNKLDIECVSDLHVGHGLRDHMGFNGINFIYNASEVSEHKEENHHKSENQHQEVIDYLKSGKGPLTSIPYEVIGFLKSEASKDKADYPDLELLFTTDLFNKGPEHLKYLNIKPEVYEQMWKPIEGYQGFSIIPILTNPKSKGVLRLHDKDPLHYPLIDLNQLSDEEEEDLETLLEGIKIAFKLAGTESLYKLGIHANTQSAPGCEKYEFDTKDFWTCQLKHLTYNLRQISGTAKMGPKTDKFAVVDNHLKVYGVHKLRVADASVIPVPISGHYMAPEILIGEKAADLIKEDWK